MNRVSRCCVVASLVVLLALQGTLFGAIRNAGSKIRGDFNSFHRSASRNMRNTRTTSRDLRTVVRDNQRTKQAVTPAIAVAHAEELGQQIKSTQKYLAEERKIAEAQDDKEVLKKLDQIDKLVAQESEEQAKLLKQCSGETVDAAAVLESCEKCEGALEKAIELHDDIAADVEEG